MQYLRPESDDAGIELAQAIEAGISKVRVGEVWLRERGQRVYRRQCMAVLLVSTAG